MSGASVVPNVAFSLLPVASAAFLVTGAVGAGAGVLGGPVVQTLSLPTNHVLTSAPLISIKTSTHISKTIEILLSYKFPPLR